MVIRGQVEGSLLLRDQLTVEPGGWVKASVSAPQMILGGAAEGEIRIRETLTLQSSGMLEGSTESGALLVAEGAILKGIIRRSGFGADNPPDQSWLRIPNPRDTSTRIAPLAGTSGTPYNRLECKIERTISWPSQR